MALCEALLACDPAKGVLLWQALRRTLRTRFLGRGNVEELLHVVFRVPASPWWLRRTMLVRGCAASSIKIWLPVRLDGSGEG
jgi:hypothetical protein